MVREKREDLQGKHRMAALEVWREVKEGEEVWCEGPGAALHMGEWKRWVQSPRGRVDGLLVQ